MSFVSFLLLSLLAGAARAHNITEILSQFPDYSQYSSYLTQTKLDDEINSRQTITCLVLNNAAMSAVAAKQPLAVVKNILSLLVLLDYYNTQKLHAISKGTTLSTTLYQTTGKADGNLGFVNITDLKGGKVGFGSAAPGSKLDASYTKSVKQIPYNISVLEITAPIMAPGITTAPSSDVNVTALLEKAGCKTFAALIVSSGVLKIYQNVISKGLTIFAPSDEAFKAAGVPDLSKLSSAEVVQLLEYHALPQYAPVGTLKTATGPIATLASNGAGKYDLKTTTAGDSVTLHSGLSSSRVSSTVVDSTPFAIFTVDNILLPAELFGVAPGSAPAPAPANEPAASPSPIPLAPLSTTPATAPSPSEPLSPPAPPMSSPTGAPASGPSASEDQSARPSAAGYARSPTLFRTLVTAFVVTGSGAIVLSSL
ncbi:fasciclin-like arabinogalactan protein 8 [Aristolochia californica]|uniref:fasciclin-like arabinogalactan protein 8 n=1 Tax=Aristolochia californica TaxID=171875 RepID=UPI0035DC3687